MRYFSVTELGKKLNIKGTPREFKTMYTQKPVHGVYSSLTHNSQRTEKACASQLMDAAAAGGTRPQWNTTQPPKGAGHRHSAARGPRRRDTQCEKPARRHLVCDPASAGRPRRQELD